MFSHSNVQLDVYFLCLLLCLFLIFFIYQGLVFATCLLSAEQLSVDLSFLIVSSKLVLIIYCSLITKIEFNVEDAYMYVFSR